MQCDGLPSSRALQSAANRETRSFEQLIADLSAAFVRATIHEIDGAINHSLRRICLFLDLDRATVARIDPANGWGSITHGWAREADRVFPISIDPNKYLPWHKEKMLAGEVIVYSSLDELPREADVDRETLRPLGPESAVVIPIKVGGVTFGAVAFGSLRRQRKWSPSLVEQLSLVADILGYALERKRNDAEFLRLHAELAHVSRVATLGEITASLAHELNQPLAAILTNAEAAQFLLRSERLDAKELGAAIQEIADNDKRASEIIKRFRVLFKRGEPKKLLFSVKELFDAVQRVIKGEAAIRSVVLRFNCPASLPGIIADQIALQQVLLNLLLNAFDAVCSLEESRRQVFVNASQPQPGVIQISVRDFGKGVPLETLPRLFDPFFTTKLEGMGMGLAIARSIVQAHGGKIWASNSPEGGATFEFTVPASDQPQSTRAPKPPDRMAYPGPGSIKIAVVDDDASQRNALTRLLESAGYEVRPFASAAEFLASAGCDGFSCVILDLRMPGVDGLGLQDSLASRSPYVPVVFVTGDADVPDTVKAMRGGAVDFLEKPVTSGVLLDAIRRAVQRGNDMRAAAREIGELKLRYQRLTPREREVFALISAGLLNKQVAAELGAAEKTIKQHRGRVMAKMEAESLAELTVMAERLGVRPSRDFSSAKGRLTHV